MPTKKELLTMLLIDLNLYKAKLRQRMYMRQWSRARSKTWFEGKNPGREKSTPEVLWSKVDIKGEDDCWEWQGFKNKEGYGRTWIKDKGYYAHRVIYDLAYPNTITLSAPKDKNAHGYLMHSCDNPSCCNPKHLSVCTHADNMADKKAKGRSQIFRSGEGPNCKLTIDDARAIRQAYLNGERTVDIAKRYGLSVSPIKLLLRGRSYKEADGSTVSVIHQYPWNKGIKNA